jgi:hypothetical protein
MCIERLFFGDLSSGATEESYSPAGAKPGSVSRKRQSKQKQKQSAAAATISE